MTRKLPVLLLPILFLFLVTAASAQTTATSTQNVPAKSTQTATDSASKLKQQVQLLQDQKKTAVTQIKDEAKALIQAKREEFKTRLQTIKDQKKKALVERIDTKIAQVNRDQTAKFTETLDRIQQFLDKFNKSATGTAVLTDAKAAQAAIDAAKAAIIAQAAKTYTMAITDDTTLKLNAGTTMSQFRRDLVAVHKLVVDAKQAVQKLNTVKTLIKKEATRQVPDGNLSTSSAKL